MVWAVEDGGERTGAGGNEEEAEAVEEVVHRCALDKEVGSEGVSWFRS